jgi:FMN phosphatase YigB (HAD superfamily)
MKKKIIFLDGDGTIWYPKKTKRKVKPHWIYHDPDTKENYLEHLELTPDAEKTINKLREKNIYLVVISANPQSEEIAVNEIKERLVHFNIASHFIFVRSSPGDDPNGKSAIMLNVLESLSIKKEDALMVGDSYYYDYMAAKDIGIDALWIENTVSKFPEVLPKDLKSIKEIHELLDIID